MICHSSLLAHQHGLRPAGLPYAMISDFAIVLLGGFSAFNENEDQFIRFLYCFDYFSFVFK
jgi:hypothetical protein